MANLCLLEAFNTLLESIKPRFFILYKLSAELPSIIIGISLKFTLLLILKVCKGYNTPYEILFDNTLIDVEPEQCKIILCLSIFIFLEIFSI